MSGSHSFVYPPSGLKPREGGIHRQFHPWRLTIMKRPIEHQRSQQAAAAAEELCFTSFALQSQMH